MLKRFQRIILAALVLFLFSGVALGQGRGKGPTMKAGLIRTMISSPTYTIENTDGSVTANNADPMTGNDVFFEYILFDRLGLELETGLTAAVRDYQLKDAGGTVITNVSESSRPVILGMNLYFSSHSGSGLKPYIGLGAGQMGVSMELNGGILAQQTFSHTVPLNTIKLGFDWIKDNSGARLEAMSIAGSTIDTTSISGYTQTVDYNATVVGIALFAFF